MAKYRKKPVVIEAVQFHQLGDHPDVRSDARSAGDIDPQQLPERDDEPVAVIVEL